MEVSSISTSYMSQSFQQNGLTDDQRTTLEEILAKYDPENMTEEEMESLRTELREAGIPRCREVGQAMAEAGFAPPEGHGGQPPAGGLQESPSGKKTSALSDALTQYENGELTEEELIELLQEYAQSGLLTAGSLVNEIA